MRTLIRGAKVLLPGGQIERADVLLEGGVIREVSAEISHGGAQTVDAAGLTLAPGYIDIHVHGGGGFSLATADAGEIASYARWVVSRGVTSFLASVCAPSLETALDYLRSVAQAAGPVAGGATLLGAHLEGPFVSRERRGALPDSWIFPPDPRALDGLLQAWGGHVRLITLAPEVPGGERLVRLAAGHGIAVALGHTDAGYEAALRAFSAGARHVTHAFNAMHPWHQRDPGPLGAALDSPAVTVEVVADGVHLHQTTVKLLTQAFGTGRVVLVTDGVTPAGLATGAFQMGALEARLEEGRVLLADGTIAGSAATMDECVRNVVNWGCANTEEALEMASAAPARVLGVSGRKGSIEPGCDADIVALDAALQVVITWAGGDLVYRRPS